MLSNTVFIHRRAEKELLSLPRHVIERFRKVFEMLEDNPYRPRPGCDIRLVKGHPHLRAVRVGDDRGIYEVVVGEKAVWFTKFGPRRFVYGWCLDRDRRRGELDSDVRLTQELR